MGDLQASVYVDGERSDIDSVDSLSPRLDRDPAAFGWLSLTDPAAAETARVVADLGLKPLLVEDLVDAGQRPKAERHGEALLLVLHPVRTPTPERAVSTGELHVVVTDRWLLTIGHDTGSLVSEVAADLAGRPAVLRRGPRAVAVTLIDRVVDDYAPACDLLEGTADDLVSQVFGGADHIGQEIYRASQQITVLQRAVRPVPAILDELQSDRLLEQADEQLQHRLRDIADHAAHLQDRTAALRDELSRAMDLTLSQQMRAQAEDSRKIAAWAGVLFVPSLVTGVYGMNFRHMPELAWPLGYLWGLGLMLAGGVAMYLIFRWRRWL